MLGAMANNNSDVGVVDVQRQYARNDTFWHPKSAPTYTRVVVTRKDGRQFAQSFAISREANQWARIWIDQVQRVEIFAVPDERTNNLGPEGPERRSR